MNLKNTTDFPDRYLRRMISWCCKELGLPVRYVKSVQFRSRHNAAYSGHAYLLERRIVVSVQARGADDIRRDILVETTAHELSHLEHYRREDYSRGGGGVGGSERNVDWHARRVLEKYRENRTSLDAEWSRERRRSDAKPELSIVEKRAVKARADLDRWTRKMKLAKTKIRKLRARVRYYSKKTAATSSARRDGDHAAP